MQSSQIAMIENYDPLRKHILQPLKLSPVRFAALILVADLIVDSWIGWKYNVFSTNSITPGLLQDPIALVTDFVYNPAIAGMYVWSTEIGTLLFRQLQGANVLDSKNRVIDVVNANRPRFRSSRAFWGILIISFVLGVNQIGGYMGWVPWKSPVGYIDLYPSVSLYRGPFWFLMFYALLFVVLNVALTIITLRQILDTQGLKFQPLHPDRSGGLSCISKYTTKVGIGIAAVGLLISTTTVFEATRGQLLKEYPLLGALLIYLIAAPAFFFWPLGTAHQAMQAAKDAELLELANEFTKTYERVKTSISRKEADFEPEIIKLESIRKLYHIAEEFPSWPFNLRSLSRFMTVITTPLLPAFLSIIVELAKVYVLQTP